MGTVSSPGSRTGRELFRASRFASGAYGPTATKLGSSPAHEPLRIVEKIARHRYVLAIVVCDCGETKFHVSDALRSVDAPSRAVRRRAGVLARVQLDVERGDERRERRRHCERREHGQRPPLPADRRSLHRRDDAPVPRRRWIPREPNLCRRRFVHHVSQPAASDCTPQRVPVAAAGERCSVHTLMGVHRLSIRLRPHDGACVLRVSSLVRDRAFDLHARRGRGRRIRRKRRLT